MYNNSMKILFIDACARKESRSRRLAGCYLKKLGEAYEEVRLFDVEFPATDEAFLKRRDGFISEGDYSDRMFDLAKQFAAADEIVIAAPFWSTIEREADNEERRLQAYLRTVFPSLLVTGPFSIVLGFTGGLMALNDRLKLRSMVVGEKDDRVFIASEEAAIRTMEPDAENVWAPSGGEPVIVRVKEGAY